MARDDEFVVEMKRRMTEYRELQERLDAALADGSPVNCMRCNRVISAEEGAANAGWCNDCAWGEYFHEP